MSKKDLKKKEKEIRKEEEEQEEVSEEEALEEAAEKVASKISTALNLGELQKKIDKIVGRSAKVKQIYTANDVKKDVDKLSKEEVIIGFFKALVRPEGPDHAVLKALSEGTHRSLEANSRTSFDFTGPIRSLTFKGKILSSHTGCWR